MKWVSRRPLLFAVVCVAALAILVTGGLVFANSRFNPVPQMIASAVPQTEKETWPVVTDVKLSEEQQKLIDILKEEFKSQPSGTKYSEGVEEPWCADFASWVYNQAGMPFTNPYSGSWRIPGTYTLREYYESNDRFIAASEGYEPEVGDLMFYDNPSPFGQHVNIVIRNENNIITTIGGNEPGGIRIITHDTKDGAGFLGYGTL